MHAQFLVSINLHKSKFKYANVTWLIGTSNQWTKNTSYPGVDSQRDAPKPDTCSHTLACW